MSNQSAELTCPYCGEKITLTRTRRGRIIFMLISATIFAILGGVIDAGFIFFGTTGGGEATIPLAIIGAVLGLETGYLIGDKIIDKYKYTSCGQRIKL